MIFIVQEISIKKMDIQNTDLCPCVFFYRNAWSMFFWGKTLVSKGLEIYFQLCTL